jgi:hypothetical protein
MPTWYNTLVNFDEGKHLKKGSISILQGILDLEGYKAFSTWHEKHVYQV